MAGKRCLSREILGSGAFTSLPPRAQLLYIQMVFEADGDGVVANIVPAMAYAGASKKDLKTLVDARFVLEAGRVWVVKHWWIHNTFRRDRYKPSAWTEDLERLYVREDGVYTDHPDAGREAFLEACRKRKEG